GLVRLPGGEVLGWHPQEHAAFNLFLLSADGGLLARQVWPTQLEVRRVGDTRPLARTPGGHVPGYGRVRMGDRWLLLESADGLRYGSPALLGAAPTPGAAERIGRLLLDAWGRAEGSP